MSVSKHFRYYSLRYLTLTEAYDNRLVSFGSYSNAGKWKKFLKKRDDNTVAIDYVKLGRYAIFKDKIMAEAHKNYFILKEFGIKDSSLAKWCYEKGGMSEHTWRRFFKYRLFKVPNDMADEVIIDKYEWAFFRLIRCLFRCIARKENINYNKLYEEILYE